MWAKALLVWLAFAAGAFVLGGLREKLLRPRIGEQRAHQAGTLAFCAYIALLGGFFARSHALTTKQGLLVGALWTAMTLAFEFGFFHYLMNKPWQELFADYNLAKGRLWPLVLLTSFLTPVLA
jgi:hypothetical protein